MAIGKTPIPYCFRRYAISVSADRTFAAGKLGHLSGKGNAPIRR